MDCLTRREDRWSRRELLCAGGGALLAGSLWPLPTFAKEAGAARLREAAEISPLVYISPLRSDGTESRCHAEVWFVTDGPDLLMVTGADRWRARAIERGLVQARVWIGDHGVWTTSDGAFRQSPSIDVQGGFERDATRQESALDAFGAKYPDEWGSWGPRFREGLTDGSRRMIRYRPATAV